MINFLSNWTQQIAIAVIIVSIFEMILPKGNLNKYIKMVLGVYIVFNIISPFVNSDALYSFNELNVENYVSDLNVSSRSEVNQESMDLRLKNLYIEQIETNVKNKVNELGFDVEKCKVDAQLDTDKSNAGISRIDLILNRKQNENDVQKVQINEISIGNILKFKDNENSQEIDNLKKSLAEYYEIDDSIINIKIK